MYDVFNKLSNVEQLSGLIRPYKNRYEKLSELAAVFSKLVDLQLETDENGQHIIQVPHDQWGDFTEPFISMQESTGGNVIFTDPTINQTVVMTITVNAEGLWIDTCESDGEGNYTARDDGFVWTATNDNVHYVHLSPQFFKDSRSSGAQQVSILDYAGLIEDQISAYDVSLEAISLTIKNRAAAASDFAARIKAKYAGLRNGSLELYQNLVDSLTVHDVSSLVSIFDKFMNPKGITVSDDGSIHFPETTSTSDLNFGAVIAQAVPQLVSTLGMVITAISKPIGIALYGLGTIASAATKAIFSQVNEQSVVDINLNSENVDLAVKIKQQRYYHSDAADLLQCELCRSAIKPFGMAPHKYELPGISGYIWPANYTGTAQSTNGCDMVHECYLNCRGYIPHEKLYELSRWDFTFSRVQYSYNAGFGTATVRITPHPNLHLDVWLSNVYSQMVPIDFATVNTMTAEEKNFIYQQCVITDSVLFVLLEALTNKLYNGDTYSDFRVAIDNHHPYPESTSVPYNIERVGIQWLCDPFHDTYYDYPMISYDSNASSWNDNPYLVVTGWDSYNETQMMKIINAIDGQSIADYVDANILKAVREVSGNPSLWDPIDQMSYDASFLFYPTEQRFDFRMRAPKYTRRSIIFNLILTGVIIAAVATITVIATVKINKWRKMKKLETQVRTEAAWDACKQNPSPENLAAYKKAAFKQNTVGKLYGCSKVSNTNYWGSVEQPNTNPETVNTDIINSIPELDENVNGLFKLIAG